MGKSDLNKELVSIGLWEHRPKTGMLGKGRITIFMQGSSVRGVQHTPEERSREVAIVEVEMGC